MNESDDGDGDDDDGSNNHSSAYLLIKVSQVLMSLSHLFCLLCKKPTC